MSNDPFHTFTTTVSSSLQSAQDLSRAYSSQSDQTSHDRLLDAIEAVQQDVEDIRQSINVVRKSPERFGVDELELRRREAFLKECEEKVLALQNEAGRPSGRRGYTSLDMGARGDQDEEDHQLAFEREHQQSLLSNQDSILSTIGRTLSSLQSQASTMGQELSEQNELIHTFDREVEQSHTRLGKAMDKMNDLTRTADGWTGGWTVWILVVLLFFLLLVAILI